MGAFDKDRSYENPAAVAESADVLYELFVSTGLDPELILVEGNRIHDATRQRLAQRLGSRAVIPDPELF